MIPGFTAEEDEGRVERMALEAAGEEDGWKIPDTHTDARKVKISIELEVPQGATSVELKGLIRLRLEPSST
jgi:hypothetical protein